MRSALAAGFLFGTAPILAAKWAGMATARRLVLRPDESGLRRVASGCARLPGQGGRERRATLAPRSLGKGGCPSVRLSAPAWGCASAACASRRCRRPVPDGTQLLPFGLLVGGPNRLVARHGSPAGHYNVAVAGLKLDCKAGAATAFGSDQRGARACEGVEDQATGWSAAADEFLAQWHGPFLGSAQRRTRRWRPRPRVFFWDGSGVQAEKEKTCRRWRQVFFFYGSGGRIRTGKEDMAAGTGAANPLQPASEADFAASRSLCTSLQGGRPGLISTPGRGFVAG
jgi:hypothetical protein